MKYFDGAVYFLLMLMFAVCTAINDEKLDLSRPGWQSSLPWLKELQKPAQGQDSYFMFNPSDDHQSSQGFDHIYPYDVEEDTTYDDETGEKDLDSSIPYGIQNVRDTKDVRRTKHNQVKYTFQSLCQAQRKPVNLNQNDVFEYRPDHYEEVSCLSPFYAGGHEIPKQHGRNKVCGEAGFSCVTLNRTIFLTRRLRGTDCWESETRTVTAGCECMWPKHSFGDIAAHH